MEHDIGSELSMEFFEGQIDVELSHAAEDHLLGFGIACEFQRGIFFDEFVKAKADLIDVRLGLGFDCERQDRLWETQHGVTDGSILLTQRITCMRVFEFSDRHDLSPARGVDGYMTFAQDSVEMAEFLSHMF